MLAALWLTVQERGFFIRIEEVPTWVLYPFVVVVVVASAWAVGWILRSPESR